LSQFHPASHKVTPAYGINKNIIKNSDNNGSALKDKQLGYYFVIKYFLFCNYYFHYYVITHVLSIYLFIYLLFIRIYYLYTVPLYHASIIYSAMFNSDVEVHFRPRH